MTDEIEIAQSSATENEPVDESRESLGTPEPRSAFGEKLASAFTFVAIYSFLFYYFRPEYIFSLTTTAGGDTGAHHYVATMMRKEFLPNGDLFGWADGWYAGFPMLNFYWTLPFLLIALLSMVMPYLLAFKMVTVLGTFLLPLSAYLCFKLQKFEFPMPQLAAVLILPFIFLEHLAEGELYSIYGGNILSTLAGEFSFTLSLSLTLLFIGLFMRALDTGQYKYLAALVLGALTLCHLITTLMLVLIAPFIMLGRGFIKRVRTTLFVFMMGFLLTAFWSVPFLENLKYTAHVSWNQIDKIGLLLPPNYWPIMPFAVLGIVGILLGRERRLLPFVFAAVVSGFLFIFLPDGRLFNGRFFPFWFVSISMIAAYGIYVAKETLWSGPLATARVPARISRLIYPIAVALIVVSLVGSTVSLVPHWIKWNYEGFEKKAEWETYRSINEFLDSEPKGRVMVEHSDGIDKFGTPRAFELLPYYAGQPTMEGTLMEAALTSPFHFVTQAEVSDKPSHAIQGVKYPNYNFSAGVTHMEMYNIRYFLAISDMTKKNAEKEPRLEKLASFGFVDIYRLRKQPNVEIVKNDPVEAVVADWRSVALEWYGNPYLFDLPVFTRNMNKPPEAADKKDRTIVTKQSDLYKVKQVSLETEGRVKKIKTTRQQISFETTAVGVPHIIKTSYYPNWKAYGAEGPYLVAPSFMMVIPKSEKVVVRYERTTTETLGRALTAFALIVILYRAVGVISARREQSPEELRK